MLSRSYKAPYGAFEMKFSHQKHMLIGMMFSVLFIAWAVVAAIRNCVPADDTASMDWHKWRTVKSVRIVDDVLPVDGGSPHPNVNRTLSKNAVGFIPDPDLDDDIDEERAVIVPRNPFVDGSGNFGDGNGAYGGGQSGVGGSGVEPGGGGREIPPRDAFIPHAEPPALVYEETPLYPKLALEGGFSAEVYLYAFVDEDGHVKKVEVVKCTRPNIGFEDAAEAAAYKNVYRPAVQNGYPVGVWIAFKVRFVAK